MKIQEKNTRKQINTGKNEEKGQENRKKKQEKRTRK